ncbi:MULTISPECIES: hypothetical protein [Parasedimentitalea]|uniref:Uncharacterized protein n=2 Tax=Parasedimentitalea TaxID=2738399 RepID=A0A6L6WMD4_9RHOB|nr:MULTISPECIES: hypothetical protein [Zongyanglinia]KAE9627368.1 hypothetical protein GP644_19575 [Zongyanglinia marina]MVO16802.1 hypothetical protein [Zongyanglinia huanghaiensis]
MGKEKLTIIKADVKNEVAKIVKPKFVELGKMTFVASCEVDSSVAKELDTDARFVAKLYDDATKEYKKLLGEVSLRVQAADNLGSVMPLTDKECKEFDADINKIFAKYQKSIEGVANAHFSKWKQANKDRKKYRLKVVSTIVIGSACAIGSTASLAAGAVTGGVSIAASIYGIAQSVVSVARAIQKVTSDLEKVHQNLEKAIKELVSAYTKQSKAKVKAKEIGKEFLADFLMIETSGFNRVDKHLETYKAKLKNLDLEAAKLGKELNKILDQQSKLDKEIDKKLGKMVKDRKYKSKKIDGLFESMEQARKATSQLIKDIEDFDARLKPAEKFRDSTQKAVDALRHKDPTWAKWAIWIGSLGLSGGVSTIAAGGQNLVKAADGIGKGLGALASELG